ncbi:MAG: hypothetical protein Q8O23_02285, partial [Gallionella sp.]|nr:hypothetical protein [Gallionella sp.]
GDKNMVDQKTTQHSLKKDKYVNARGGNSRFLDLFCSKCNQHIVLYQKDGHGRLLRMYLDRIFEPQEVSLLHSRISDKTGMPNLKCQKCGALIGTPMIYEAEKRLAFRLIHGSIAKKKSDGVYPSPHQNQSHEKGGSDENRN